MKTVLLLIASALCLGLADCRFRRTKGHSQGHKYNTPIPANFSVHWHVQEVDHFGYANNDHFKQRVLISTDHWCDGCPIFFYAGNEGDIFMFANNTGFMWENAPHFRAMVVFAEHRYYGESMPYGNRSFENLAATGYLTAEQALADFAENIMSLKHNYPGAASSPVVMFGGSYGGMLASWFRMKYPHLVEGALAASAPILQFPEIYDCSGYFRIISKDFEAYSESCSESIRRSWPAIRRQSETSEGRQWLKDTFHLCQDLVQDNVETFIGWLIEAYGDLAMTDYPNPASFLQPLPAYPIKEVCKRLTNPAQEDKPLLTDLYNAVSVYFNYSGKADCNNIKEDSQLGLDGWDFQSCTEMVMPVCSDGVQDMFEASPWNFTQVSDSCYSKWSIRPQKYKAELMFGGRNISAASNIIFSNGERDPWSAGGVLEEVSESVVVLKVPNACHHEDLRATGPDDPPGLLNVREIEKKTIKQWIDDYYTRTEIFPKEWLKLFVQI